MHVMPRRQSADLLVLDMVPVAPALYVAFGVALMLCGLWVARTLGRAQSLRCAWISGTATCRAAATRLPLWPDDQRFELRGARLDTVRTAISVSLLLVVRTDRGDVPVPLVGADGRAKDSLAAALNDLARRPDAPGLLIREDRRVLGWLFGLALVAAGVLCLAAMERVRVTLDRRAGWVHLFSRRWFRSTRVDLELARVRGVSRQAFTIRRARSWSVHLDLDGGRKQPLTRAPLFTERSAGKVEGLIEGWLPGPGRQR